jgi:cyanophycinase
MIKFFLVIFFIAFPICAQNIIAVGGGDQSRFLPIFLEKAGGEKAKIALIMVAANTLENQTLYAHFYRKRLPIRSSQFVFRPILSKDDANNTDFVNDVSRCSGVILGGGDQIFIAERIRGTKLHEILLDFARKGGTILSNSAGTAALGPIMITGDDPTTERVFLAEGLSLIDSIIFDQHFLQRNRRWRLEEAISRYPNLIGKGIDEGSALIIEGDSTKEIGKVTIIKSGK